jgi:hypothetical protein
MTGTKNRIHGPALWFVPKVRSFILFTNRAEYQTEVRQSEFSEIRKIDRQGERKFEK